MSFWGELRRRNVFKIGAAYVVVAWVLIQVAVSIFPVLSVPDWATALITVLLILGFPVALVLAWASEGASRVEDASAETSPPGPPELTPATERLPATNPLMRFDVDLGLGVAFLPRRSVDLALSPDGMQLAFVSRDADGTRFLYTRRLDEPGPRRLASTEGARSPFFSPDGQWIGYFDERNLNKISAQGGAPVAMCGLRGPYPAGVWGDDGSIIATGIETSDPGRVGLKRISAAGGVVETVTQLDAERGESHDWPQLLPGGKAVLFTVRSGWGGRPSEGKIDVQRLETGERKTLHQGGSYGRYLPSGHLVYVADGTLFAAPMNLERLELTGVPVPMVDGISASAGGFAQFAFSRTGTLVYLKQSGAEQMIVQWLDRAGAMQPLLSEPGQYAYPSFSPDGGRLALQVTVGGNADIFVYDLARETMTQLTFSPEPELNPTWTPDGKYVVFASAGGELCWIRSNGTGGSQRLLEPQDGVEFHNPSFSADGSKLVCAGRSRAGGFGVWTARVEGRDPPRCAAPERLLGDATPASHPALSPDGRWLAYAAFAAGALEAYVSPASSGPEGSGGKWRVSAGSGRWPIWSPNGRDLFYRTGEDRIMVVGYRVNGEAFEHDRPALWGEHHRIADIGLAADATLAPDGERFAVITPAEGVSAEPQRHVTFLLNFFDELRRRVPNDGS